MSDSAPLTPYNPNEERQLAIPSMGEMSEVIFSSFEAGGDEGAIALTGALVEESNRLIDEKDIVIPVEHIVLKEFTSVDDETGEIKSGLRLLLIASDGVIYSTNSKYAIADVGTITRMVGNPPWNPPKHLKSRKIACGSNKSVIRICMVKAIDTKKKG